MREEGNELLHFREKAHEAGVLDRDSKLTLIFGRGSSDGTRSDFAIDADVMREQFGIFVVNVFDVVLFEVADLAATMRFSKSHVV